MKRIALLAAVALALAACGGGGDSPVNAAQAQAVAGATGALDLNTNGIRIQRPAGVNDGYDGGLNMTRDTSQLSGGTPGNVNTLGFLHGIVGKLVTAFEWTLLVVQDNYADAGENVAAYFQNNKHSTGPSWALVSECSDTTGLRGACVSHEADVWITGPDNGSRVGIDVVAGDALAIRGIGKSAVAEATVGLRISATPLTPYARWVRGIQLAGTFPNSAIDLSLANAPSAIRLAAGQRITFNASDSLGVYQDPATNELVFGAPGAAPLMRLAPSGDLRIAGHLIQGGQ